MNKKTLIVLLILTCIMFGVLMLVKPSSKKTTSPVTNRPTVSGKQQGVIGNVVAQVGTCRATDQVSATKDCTFTPLNTKILIYSPPILYQKAENGMVYQTFGDQKPLKEVETDSKGSYLVQLPVGEYSLFIEKAGQPYCVLNNNNKACPVAVNLGNVTQYNITFKDAL